MGRSEYKRTLPQEIIHEARSRLGQRACGHDSLNCYCDGVNCTEFVFEVGTSVFTRLGYPVPKVFVERGSALPIEPKMSTTPLFDLGFSDMAHDIDWEDVSPGDIYFKSNAYAMVHMGIVERVYKGWFNPSLRRIDPVIDGIDSQGICGGVIGRKKHERRVETLANRPHLGRNYRYNLRAMRFAPYNPQTGWHEV